MEGHCGTGSFVMLYVFGLVLNHNVRNQVSTQSIHCHSKLPGMFNHLTPIKLNLKHDSMNSYRFKVSLLKEPYLILDSYTQAHIHKAY